MDESNRLRWPIDQSSNKYYSPKQIENQRTNKLILVVDQSDPFKLTLITDFKVKIDRWIRKVSSESTERDGDDERKNTELA